MESLNNGSIPELGSIKMEDVRDAACGEEGTFPEDLLSYDDTTTDSPTTLFDESIQNNNGAVGVGQETFSNDEMTTATTSTSPSDGRTEVCHSKLMTLREWRAELRKSVGGEYDSICIDRSNDFKHNLLEVYNFDYSELLLYDVNYTINDFYKEPDCDFYKTPYITFLGEEGGDDGGLMREYFWLGMTTLRDGKSLNGLPFFEGEIDYKLPSCDATFSLHRDFKLIGRFMVHSTVHMGIGFVGLSNVVVQYIMSDMAELDSETPMEINIRDLPDLELRNVISIIDEWTKTVQLPCLEDFKNLQEAAIDCKFHGPVNLKNLRTFRKHFMYFHVIEKRRSELDCLRLAFQEESKLLTFLRDKDYLWSEIFPRSSQFIYPSSVINEKIVSFDEDEKAQELVGFVKDYVLEKLDGTEGIRDLVTAWTGWPDLPENELEIQMTDHGEFMIHTCSRLITIPANYLKEDVYNYLDMVLKFACYGFGSI